MAQGFSLAPVKQTMPPDDAWLPQTGEAINVHRAEGLLSLLGGGALLTFAWRQRGGWGVVAALLGCELLRRGVSRHSFLYQGLHIDTARQASAETVGEVPSSRTERAVTINRSPQELYHYWRHFEQLPAILPVLKEVQIQNTSNSRWTLRAPGGLPLTWEAEIVSDEPGEHIAWRTLPGSAVPQRGSIQFSSAPGERGTEVKVILEYTLPGGKAADLLAKAFRVSPDQHLREGLRQFKAIMETGEIPRA